ncbi:MAG: hypothetical protein PHR06_14895, partial [Candidatus Cloacimonetes bacterium]|nr:hypothetical protein [Candidatus Cloacimonadota bacterium]
KSSKSFKIEQPVEKTPKSTNPPIIPELRIEKRSETDIHEKPDRPDNWDSDGFVPDNRYNYLTIFNGVVNNVTVGLGGVDDNQVLPIQFTPGSLEIWLMSAPPPNQHLQYSVLKFRTNPLSQVVCENNQFFYLTFESNGQTFAAVELRLVDNYNFRPWIKFEMDYNSDQEWIPLNTDQVELFGVEQMDNIYHTYQLPEGAVSLGYHSINQDGSINGISTDYPIRDEISNIS